MADLEKTNEVADKKPVKKKAKSSFGEKVKRFFREYKSELKKNRMV